MRGRLLYLTEAGKGLLYKGLAFYLVDLQSENTELIAKLPIEGIKGIIGKIRVVDRLLRIEPRCIGRVDENRYVVPIFGKIWVINTVKKTLKPICDLRKGFGVLNFCEGHDGLYYGDYGVNSNYDNVNIYRIDSDLKNNIVYTFPQGSIRHIHNIRCEESGFLIMTGDNEKKAGIYRVSKDWGNVEPWKIGEQRYRTVAGFPYQGGLLYATDSVEKENHIRYIGKDGDEKVLTAINGSCIYGCETMGFFLFSTTVEPHEGQGLMHKFTYRLGGGIKNRNVEIVAVDKKDLSFNVVKQLHKDNWPMVLFQYGRVRFAGGQQVSDAVWCSPVACRHYDGKTIKIELK